VVRACYTYFDLLRFYSGNPGKLNCFQTCIYIIYILFCLIGFMNFSPQLYLIRKNKKTLSIGFYYTIHFILIVFFSDTRIHTFIIFALILLICFCCQYFFLCFQILKSMRWDDKEFYTACHTTSWEKAEKKRLVHITSIDVYSTLTLFNCIPNRSFYLSPCMG